VKPTLDLRTAKVAVELTSRCNLRCAMCPMNDLRRPLEDMPFSLVEKIAADFKNNGVTVEWLHEMGDPLLYPRIGEAVDLFPGCSVSTNAMVLTEAVGARLLASSLRRLRLCVDTLDPEIYVRMRRGGTHEVVVANIRRFLDAARGSAMRVEIQRMISTETRHESVKDFARFFDLARYPNAVVIEKTCEPLDTVEATELHQAYYGCFQGYPFRWFIVLADGGVTHCCYDAHGEQRIGDLKTQTVQEILAGPRLAELAAAYRAKDWSKLPRCGECFRNPSAKVTLLDHMLRLGHRLDRYLPIKPLARRFFNR
jgi:hypothetical protein